MTTDFNPDWVSPPGETISDLLEERQVSLEDFSKRLQRSERFATGLLRGTEQITADVAKTLANTVGRSSNFWLNREAQYRVALDKKKSKKRVEELIAELPIKQMVELKWLPFAGDESQLLGACLRFFGVDGPSELKDKYLNAPELVAFHTSPTFPSEPGAVAAWLRRGELMGEAIECEPWNPQLLRDSLGKIRALTREADPNVFLPKLREIFAKCGVAFVAVRAPKGCRASGATKFLSPDKALLLLSFRHLADDHVWFSLFHEVGHLLLHGKDSTFVDGVDTQTDQREREANEFSANTLVPPEHRAAMLKLPLHGVAVVRFARSIGIAPGIVVGQLQHLGRFTRLQLNNLKRRYQWAD